MGRTVRTAGLAALVMAMTAGGMAAAELYVSPGGDDGNPGTIDGPLATPAAARDRVRAMKKDRPITVYLRGGQYHLAETLVLGPEDSGTVGAPVTYAAYPGEKVGVLGSRTLDLRWTVHKGDVIKATVPKGPAFDQLFVDGVRQVRARFPNYDPADPLRSGRGYQPVAGGSNKRYDTWVGFDPKAFTSKDWADPTTGILHAFQSHNWGNMQYRVKAVDRAQNRILLGEGGWQLQRSYGIGAGRGKSSPFYVENIFEELDAPGEWFLDVKTATLYFLPPEGLDVDAAEFAGVVVKDLIQLIGTREKPVHHIALRGVRFSHCRLTFMEKYEPLARGDWAIHRGGAVFLQGAEDCRVEDCNFEYVGGNGVFVSKYSRRNVVAGCRFFHTGESGVAFVGSPEAVRVYQTWDQKELRGKPWLTPEKIDDTPGPQTPDYPEDCTVDNCITHEIGDFGKQTSGVIVSMSHRITIRHCTVYNIPRAGITFNDGAWGGHVLEHCDIWETVRESGEHGPFNSWGRERMWMAPKGEGGMIKKLVKHDAMTPTIIRNNRIANYRESLSAGNWTIDLDDGSSNYHIYNNLSLGSTLKLRDGYFRKVFNNIHVSPVSLGWHCWPADSDDEFFTNITVLAGAKPGDSEPAADFLRPARMPEHPWGRRHDHNLWWNVNTEKFKLSGMDWDKWRELGYGEGSTFADPMFVDPAGGDYRVKEGSPALKLGFENFPMDRFGHRMTRIVPFGGQFVKRMSVTLKPDARGGQVRYTLDGSAPTAESALYAEPLVLDEKTTVTALTFKDGLPVGFAETATFEKVAKVSRPNWLQTIIDGKWAGPAAREQKQVTRVWLGATLTDITDGDLIDALGGQEKGVYMVQVPAGSQAGKAGFVKGDVIVRFGEHKIDRLSDLLPRIVRPNAEEAIVIVRRGYDEVKVRLPKAPPAPPAPKPPVKKAPGPIEPSADGALLLQPVDARIVGSGIKLHPNKTNFGSWRSEQSYPQWRLRCPKAGKYRVQIVYGCPAGSAGGKVEVIVGQTRLAARIEHTGGSDYRTYKAFAVGAIELPEGETTLEVRAAAPGETAPMNLGPVQLVPESAGGVGRDMDAMAKQNTQVNTGGKKPRR